MEPVSPMSIPVLYLNQTFYAKPGQKKDVLLAQIEAFSMKMDYVSQLALNVIVSTKLQEIVLLALLDMTSSKENVFIHLPIPLHQVILDVVPGTGRIKNVLPAQRDGPSMLKISAYQLLTNVKLMMPLVIVPHATKDMT